MQIAKREQRLVKQYITGRNMMVKIIPFLTNTKKQHRKKTAVLRDVI